MTKATARGVLAAWCSGLLCSLGVLVFVIVLTEQFHASLRESVLAMNDPARLAHFERALQEARLVTGLILAATVIVSGIGFAWSLKLIRAALRAD